MQFDALSERDLKNVAAINAAYLRFLAADGSEAERQRRMLPGSSGERARGLGPAARVEVAACPFLLCSLREISLGPDAPGCRTLELVAGTGSGLDLVAFMALSLLRRIARRSPYAARVVSGTGVGWCRELLRLDEPTIAGVARAQAPRVRPVHAGVPPFWTELMTAEAGKELRRRAVRAMGLQLLQCPVEERPQALAARRLRVTRRRRGS